MPASAPVSLRLFVAADSPDSAIALANLQALFPDGESDVQLQVVDVRREPDVAARDRIMVTPTLLKVAPAPGCRILGNLKNRSALFQLLGIPPRCPDPKRG